MDYWNECVSEALDEAGITATDEQIATITDCIEGAHENYGMAHGHDMIPNPLQTENEQLKKDLKNEQDKITCKNCNGTGKFISYGGTLQAESSCWKCHGEGRYLP